ncbi:hypothetical protein [Methylocella tundrae]|uniref:Uncharacterized protein n=1 Tax=Methylocella tundrae TaxID=227605 RepID=A0A4U8Z1Z4_METTU|nr:hypothetical protein [Methylocella tundrae]WPP03300.1 hypothetical protein SIN04_12500 [Methylocella tundrae]VFU09333.1 protein of unknown function [Methylocella tundrae]
MKIAFVNEPFAHMLPPYQSSVGGCGYRAARCLGKFSHVTVYGLHDLDRQANTCNDVDAAASPHKGLHALAAASAAARLSLETRLLAARRHGPRH